MLNTVSLQLSGDSAAQERLDGLRNVFTKFSPLMEVVNLVCVRDSDWSVRIADVHVNAHVLLSYLIVHVFVISIIINDL